MKRGQNLHLMAIHASKLTIGVCVCAYDELLVVCICMIEYDSLGYTSIFGVILHLRRKEFLTASI